MRVIAPAKINLFLKVKGKRPDGYHDIISLMQAVSLYDVIDIDVEEGNAITVESSGLEVPQDSDNLVWKAAEAVLNEAGLKRKVSMGIEKNIPVAGGLGGGSSDAASVIMALNELLGAPIDKTRRPLLTDITLNNIALNIGSDVPFFLLKSSAIAQGRGERLEAVRLPPLSYVLINPGFHVLSSWAYGNLRLTKTFENNILKCLKGLLHSPEGLVRFLANDLEDVVIKRYPIIRDLKKMLLGVGARRALMSGSGPTVFGVFFDEVKAKKAYIELKEKILPPWRIYFVKGC